MIKVIKEFYKSSEKKSYKIGEVASFDAKTERSLVDNGYAEVVKEAPKKKNK